MVRIERIKRTQRWRSGSTSARAQWLAVACIVLVGACSAEESTTPTVELSSTSTPITTEPTTTEPPTTEAPTTTEDPRIAEVEAFMDTYHGVQVLLLTDVSADVGLATTVLTGEALDSATETTLRIRADGLTIAGDFSARVDEVTFVDDAAIVLECGLDGLASTDATGELVTPADQTAYLREYELVRSSDGTWRVGRVTFPGAAREPCEF